MLVRKTQTGIPHFGFAKILVCIENHFANFVGGNSRDSMVAQEFKMRSEKKKSFLLRQVALLVFMLSEQGFCDLKLDCTYLQLHSWSYLWAVYA